jgi:hypothetical protein
MVDAKYLGYLESLGKRMGLALKYDENNVCEIIVNSNDVVDVVANPEDHNLLLSSVIAPDLPDPVSYSVVIDLMDLALGPVVTHGGNCPVVGRDPETGMLVAYQVCTESYLDEGSVYDIFMDFFKFKLSLSQHIEKNAKV